MPAAGAGRCWVAADGVVVRWVAFLCGVTSRAGRGPGEEGSQPYLGARGAGAAPATRCLIGCPRLRGCGRSVLLGRPPGSWRQEPAAADRRLQALAAVVPHRVSVA